MNALLQILVLSLAVGGLAPAFSSVETYRPPGLIHRLRSLCGPTIIRPTVERDPKQWGKLLSSAEDWRGFKSGWREFPWTTTRRYGEAYRPWVERAKTATDFDTFIGLLEEGARYASARAGRQNAHAIGQRVSERGAQFSFVSRDTERVLSAETWRDFARVVDLDSIAEPLPRLVKRKLTVSLDGVTQTNALILVVHLGEAWDRSRADRINLVVTQYLLSGKQIDRAFERMRDLYQIAKGDEDRAAYEATLQMAKLIRRGVLYRSGSSGIADALTKALLEPRGYKMGEVRDGIGLDLKTWTSESDAQLFEEYPSYFR